MSTMGGRTKTKRSPRADRRKNETILHEIVRENGLTANDVARLTRVSPWTAQSWLKGKTNESFRKIPDGLLELICLKVGQESPFKDD